MAGTTIISCSTAEASTSSVAYIKESLDGRRLKQVEGHPFPRISAAAICFVFLSFLCSSLAIHPHPGQNDCKTITVVHTAGAEPRGAIDSSSSSFIYLDQNGIEIHAIPFILHGIA